MERVKILLVIGATFGLAGTWLAFFEQALDNGTPFWSSVLGAPFLHHGYYFLIILTICFLALVIIIWSPLKRGLCDR